PEIWTVDKQVQRLPYFDEVKIVIPETPGTDSLLFTNGKSDAHETVRPQEFEQFKQASMKSRFKLMDLGIGAERDFIWFNQNTGTNRDGKPIVNPVKLKWFRNRNFRQAISRAIDLKRI